MAAPVIFTWGANGSGQCCTGEEGPVLEQRPRCVNSWVSRGISNGTPIAAVAAGESHTLFLTGYGDVFAFGRTKEGQLGLGQAVESLNEVRTPSRIEALRPWHIVQVASGSKHCAAVSSCGRCFEWGLLLPLERAAEDQAWAARRHGLGRDFQEDLNERQQRIVAESWSRYLKNETLGRGDNGLQLISAQDCHRDALHVPRQAAGLEHETVLTVACGYAHTVAAVKGGGLRAGGYGEKGQLGNGERCPSARFIESKLPGNQLAAAGDESVQALRRRSLLACGQNHTAAITQSGGLLTWGLGVFGQLGLGLSDRKEQKLPALVTSLTDAAVQVACGDHHTVVLLANGVLLTFGHRDAVGGKSHFTRSPEVKQELSPSSGCQVEQVFAGGTGCFALTRSAVEKEQATLQAWGYNQRFQLGRYTAELQLLRPGPVALPRVRGAQVCAFAAGTSHCVALVDAPQSCVLPLEVGEPFFGSGPMLAALKGEAPADVVVVAGGPKEEPLMAHRAVLLARCPALLPELQRPSASSAWQWDLRNSERPASCAAAAALLEYIYTDHCRAAVSVAAELRPLALHYGLGRLAAGVASATETQSVAQGARWVRSAAGKWEQVMEAEDEDAADQPSTSSSYHADMEKLVKEAVSEVEAEDYLPLLIKELESGHERRIFAARSLLLTVEFFQALLEGQFAEATCLRQGAAAEIAAESADALVLCLRMLATGNRRLLPERPAEVLAVLVEAHRLGLHDIVSAAESELGLLALQLTDAEAGDEEAQQLRAALLDAAQLFGLPKVAAALNGVPDQVL